MLTESSVRDIFHPRMYNVETLRQRVALFFLCKTDIDEKYYAREQAACNLRPRTLAMRCFGREMATGLSRQWTHELILEKRLQNSIGSRLRLFLLQLEHDDSALYAKIGCALELFSIAFNDATRKEYESVLPRSKWWLLDYVRKEIVCLLTNDFDQPSYGLYPVLTSVKRVRAMFVNALFPESSISFGFETVHLPTSMFKMRASKYRERLRKKCVIPILTKRVSSSIIIPPIKPMPDTSEGVGSRT